MAGEQARPDAEVDNAALPPNAMDKRWYAYIDGQNYGPYSGRDIEGMIGNGQIHATDFLCVEGGSAWTEAKNEPVFRALFQAPSRIPAPPSTATANDAATVSAADPAPVPKKSRGVYQAVFQDPNQDKIRQDLRDFFGPHADKYLAIYDRMRSSNKPNVFTFNWVVFLTSFPWFFYRKMYVIGALVILLPVLAAYLLGLTGNAGVAVSLCMMANSQYVQSAIRRMKKADVLGLVGEERQDYLRRAGGVSVVAGVLASLLFVAAAALAVFGAYLKHHKAVH